MVLDFGGGSLFRNQDLQQDGRLAERWGQDGSTLVNVSTTVDNSDPTVTLYTVTAGKRFYVNSLSFSDSSGDVIVLLKDGGAGGTTKLTLTNTTTAQTIVPLSLPTPIYFDTDVYIDGTGLTNMHANLQGWEEQEP